MSRYAWQRLCLLVVVGLVWVSFAVVPVAHAATATTVVGWGDNTAGEGAIPAGLTNATAIGAGTFTNLALKSDGTVVAWGSNDYGQVNVPAGLSGVTAIAAGGHQDVALKSDGTIVTWGDNTYGQQNIPAGLNNVTAISSGYTFSEALKSDGTVVAWGQNNVGQTDVPAGLSGVVAISAGYFHSLALKSDGSIVAWGYNGSGVLNIPAGLSGVTAISAGYTFSLALKSDGTLVAWGDNTFRQLDIPAGLSNVTAIDAGAYHSLALKSDGTVVSWGLNTTGETTIPSGLHNVLAVAAGQYQSIALALAQPQSITFAALPDTTYGAAPISLSATATSGLPVSFSATGSCQVSGTTLTLTGAGQCTVTASQAGNATYAPATDVQHTFTIAKAALTVTANDASTVYGAPLPTLTGSLSGVTNGDTITVSYSTTATQGSPASTYPITATLNDPGNRLGNYSVTNTPGTLTITQAATTLTLSLTPNTPVVGQSETLTATPAVVAPGAGTPTGSVTFTIDGTVQTPVPLSNGSATFVTAPLTLGNHTFAASYSGDTNFLASNTSSNSAIGYGICALPNTRHWRAGGIVRFYLTVCDATLHNISARSLHVTAVGVDGQALPAHRNSIFRYIRRLVPVPGEVGGGGYSYSLKTAGLHLSAGVHVLNFTVAGDSVPHSVSFTVSTP